MSFAGQVDRGWPDHLARIAFLIGFVGLILLFDMASPIGWVLLFIWAGWALDAAMGWAYRESYEYIGSRIVLSLVIFTPWAIGMFAGWF